MGPGGNTDTENHSGANQTEHRSAAYPDSSRLTTEMMANALPDWATWCGRFGLQPAETLRQTAKRTHSAVRENA
jgi:hypothetical protein